MDNNDKEPTIMKYTRDTKCDICGRIYDGVYVHRTYSFYNYLGPLYSGDSIAITTPSANTEDKYTVECFKICPKCARSIKDYIALLKFIKVDDIVLNPKATPHDMGVDLDKIDVTDEIEMLRAYEIEMLRNHAAKTLDFCTNKLFEMFEEFEGEDDGNI